MFVSPPHGEDGSQALGEQPPSLLPAVTALEMPPPRSKAAGGHTHTQPLPPRPPQLGCAGGIWAVRDPPPPSRCSFTTMGTLYPVVGPTFGGTPGRAGHPPHCCLPWSPPKQWRGGTLLLPHCTPPPAELPPHPKPAASLLRRLETSEGANLEPKRDFCALGTTTPPFFVGGKASLCGFSPGAAASFVATRGAGFVQHRGGRRGDTHTVPDEAGGPSLTRRGPTQLHGAALGIRSVTQVRPLLFRGAAPLPGSLHPAWRQ